jgi:hypothetical protein
VVEGARLESECWGNSTVGSNPTLSATSQIVVIAGLHGCLATKFPPTFVGISLLTPLLR